MRYSGTHLWMICISFLKYLVNEFSTWLIRSVGILYYQHFVHYNLCILDYEIVNNKECVAASTRCISTECPKCRNETRRNIIPNQIRRYNNKENIFKRMTQNQFAAELWALKKEMKGRRHTPEIMKLHKLLRKMTVTQATVKSKVNKSEIKKKNNKKQNTIKGKARTESNLFTRIIKKETVYVDGKLVMKIVKGTTIANK